MPPGPIALAFGNETHTTAWHLERALERRGLEVITAGPGHPTTAVTTASVIWVESGTRWLPPSLSDAEPPASVAWVIDTHRAGRWRRTLPGVFGAVAYAQRAASLGAAVGERTSWVPLAAPMDLARPDLDLRDRPYDVAFVGQAPTGSRRAEIVRAIASEASVYVPKGRITPAEMMEVYGGARIVINIPLAGELNMRAFEAAASRAVLVCAPTADLAEILPDLYRLVDDDDPAAWVRAVSEVLRSDDSQRLADEAHRVVAAAHTYDHRADALLTLVGLPGAPRQARARAMATVFAELGDRAAIRSLPLPRAERLAWRAAATGARIGKSVIARTPRRWRLAPGPKF